MYDLENAISPFHLAWAKMEHQKYLSPVQPD